jgi:CelD/BcsL family acetyltransferase involved in cellulose biosynthesis
MSTSLLAPAPRTPSRTPDPGAPLRAEAVGTEAALAALRPEWERLWHECPTATPFQCPQWLLPWWRHVGRGTLATLALRAQDGFLAGLVPLYIYRQPDSGRRHLFPLGIATSDDLDLLARPGHEAQMLAALAAHLETTRESWDVLEAPQLPPQALLRRLPVPAGWQADIAADDPHPVLAWPPGSTPALPKALAANLRTCRNRAARAGEVRFETADAASLPELLAALFRLHAARWSERSESGVLAAPAVRAWHAEAAPRLLAAGMLRLHALRLDGEPIAVACCLADPAPAHARRCRYYIGGFDPRHAALSPGALLIAHAIERAYQEGATGFDFLRGAEDYKYRWGAIDEARHVLRLRAA